MYVPLTKCVRTGPADDTLLYVVPLHRNPWIRLPRKEKRKRHGRIFIEPFRGLRVVETRQGSYKVIKQYGGGEG